MTTECFQHFIARNPWPHLMYFFSLHSRVQWLLHPKAHLVSKERGCQRYMAAYNWKHVHCTFWDVKKVKTHTNPKTHTLLIFLLTNTNIITTTTTSAARFAATAQIIRSSCSKPSENRRPSTVMSVFIYLWTYGCLVGDLPSVSVGTGLVFGIPWVYGRCGLKSACNVDL